MASLKMVLCASIGLGYGGVCLPQANAFELFGIHFWGEKKPVSSPDTIGEPKYYRVDIHVAGQDEEIDKTVEIVKTASELVSDADKPASGAAGLIARARGDYRRLLAALYAQGYYGSVLSITINGEETADLDIDAFLPEHSDIVITVEKGALYRFGRAQVEPLAPVKNNRDKILPGRKKPHASPLPHDFATGEVARSSLVLRAEQDAINGWRQQGYAKAKTAQREIVADHAAHTLDANIDIEPGIIAHYGDIRIRNHSEKVRVDSAYIAWMTGLKQGQSYDPEEIRLARKRLARLDVFRSVTISEAEQIEPDGTLPMHVDVHERPPRRFGAGGSYSTLDGAGFEAYWLHRSLFGHGETLRFDARISGIGGNQDKSLHPENYTYMLGGNFTRPGVLTPDTDFLATIKAEREVLDNYTIAGLYLQTGLSHVFNDELSTRAMINVSRTRAKDDYFGARNFTLLGLGLALTYDSRDDKNDARTGLYAEAHFEPLYEAGNGNFIAKSTVEGRAYHPFDKRGRLVLAGRFKWGTLVGADVAEIPSNMLFFAGGGGSVRGYGYRNIGTRTSTGDVIGGRSLFEASGEARMDVTRDIGLVGFIDAGQVGEESWPAFSAPLKWGAGGGLRYKTGLGSVRLDVARPLNGVKGDPDLGLYIGIGQAF